MLRTLVLALSLALTVAGVPESSLAAEAGVFEGLSGAAVAQARRRRRRRRGRRSRPPAPPKPKTNKKKDDKAKDKDKEKEKASQKAKAEKKKGKKKKNAKKNKKRKKKAPKTSKPKEPLLPKNFGKILLFSGSGVSVIGLGVAAWGATIHNDAVAERHRLQDREANTANQMQAFYDLHTDTETGKTIHFVGLGLAGVAALTAAVGSLL